MRHIMIDLEALDSASTGVLVSLGAVKFDLETGNLGEEFYQVIVPYEFKEQASRGRTINVDTLIWWMQQSNEARAVFKDTKNQNRTEGLLKDFTKFCQEGSYVWGNGADFDNVFLRSVYQTYNIACPFIYKNHRCYRTYKAMHGNRAKLERVGTHHNGLDDAKTQAMHLIKMYQAVTKGKN